MSQSDHQGPTRSLKSQKRFKFRPDGFKTLCCDKDSEHESNGSWKNLQHTPGFTVLKMMKNLLAPLSLVTCGHLSVVMLPLIITHRNSNALCHTHTQHTGHHHPITLETGPRLTTTHTRCPPPSNFRQNTTEHALFPLRDPSTCQHPSHIIIQLLGKSERSWGDAGSVCGQLGSSSDDVMARCEGWTGAANRIWVAPIHT